MDIDSDEWSSSTGSSSSGSGSSGSSSSTSIDPFEEGKSIKRIFASSSQLERIPMQFTLGDILYSNDPINVQDERTKTAIREIRQMNREFVQMTQLGSGVFPIWTNMLEYYVGGDYLRTLLTTSPITRLSDYNRFNRFVTIRMDKIYVNLSDARCVISGAIPYGMIELKLKTPGRQEFVATTLRTGYTDTLSGMLRLAKREVEEDSTVDNFALIFEAFEEYGRWMTDALKMFINSLEMHTNMWKKIEPYMNEHINAIVFNTESSYFKLLTDSYVIMYSPEDDDVDFEMN